MNNVDLFTEQQIKDCNHILVHNEKKCGGSNRSKKNNSSCVKYDKCKSKFKSFMSGHEPELDLVGWANTLIEGSHNCYIYSLDDKNYKIAQKCLNDCKSKGYNNKTCRTNKSKISSCGRLKPQPGHWASLKKRFKSNSRYTCSDMMQKVKIDNHNPKTGKSHIYSIPFDKPCKPGFYKAGVTIQTGPNSTYHFYRQDSNGKWSHKPGTLPVETVDASGKPIYAPHHADRNYRKGNSSGLNYDKWCNYFCVPSNDKFDTHAI